MSSAQTNTLAPRPPLWSLTAFTYRHMPQCTPKSTLVPLTACDQLHFQNLCPRETDREREMPAGTFSYSKSEGTFPTDNAHRKRRIKWEEGVRDYEHTHKLTPIHSAGMSVYSCPAGTPRKLSNVAVLLIPKCQLLKSKKSKQDGNSTLPSFFKKDLFSSAFKERHTPKQ